MPIRRDLSLTGEERDRILNEEWNMRISTVSPSGRINATPLWFVWHMGRVWSYCRGQKVHNMRQDPRCTVLVDRAERFGELQGVMIQGEVRILESVEAEAADPDLDEVRVIYGVKYHGGHGEEPTSRPEKMSGTARGSSWRWVEITPTHMVTWDNTKLSG